MPSRFGSGRRVAYSYVGDRLSNRRHTRDDRYSVGSPFMQTSIHAAKSSVVSQTPVTSPGRVGSNSLRGISLE